MTDRLNSSIIRLALGCIQPASAANVGAFLRISLPAETPSLQVEAIQEILDEWVILGDVSNVHQRHRLYSLTKNGDAKLSAKERRLRDRTRLFLLKDLRSDIVRTPEDKGIEQADVSSAVIFEMTTQEDERPIGAAESPRRARSSGRAYWPLLSRQLFVGSSSSTSGIYFRFLSFPSVKRCCESSGQTEVPATGIGLAEIALALGISPRLLGVLIHRPEKYYRTFEIPKANGKMREINAPRTAMKVAQYFVLDYLLKGLRVHSAATAYGQGCSIKKNATFHVGRRYVANIDVENFFGSLTREVVQKELLAAGLLPDTAEFVARLSSYKGGLPQGAPTSAQISNLCLYKVDEALSVASAELRVSYSRYADDITFSGDDRESVKSCIALAAVQLGSLGLRLNKTKTRIFGPSSRQMVTGLVVNERVQPTRQYRRNLRSMLHHAKQDPEQYVEKRDEIVGKVAYVLSFADSDRGIGAVKPDLAQEVLTRLREISIKPVGT